MKHVTIVRSGRLGDIALILPAARALQAEGTRVSWLIGPDSYRLVRDISDIEWHLLQGGLCAGRSIAKHIPPDTRFCVLENPGLEASLAINGAPQATCMMGHFTSWDGNPHQLRRYWYSVTGRMPRDTDHARWFLQVRQTPRYPCLAINPCASTPERDWSPEGYAAVAAFALTAGLEPVVVHSGAARELEMLAAIRRHLRVQDCQCDLKTLLEGLSGAMCLVSPDSGPVHLAGITGTPVVGIYGRTDIQRWGPYWSRQWCVQGNKGALPDVQQVLERLQALDAAGYPRCGGEGARLIDTQARSTHARASL